MKCHYTFLRSAKNRIADDFTRKFKQKGFSVKEALSVIRKYRLLLFFEAVNRTVEGEKLILF
jgi:hypothetical protein